MSSQDGKGSKIVFLCIPNNGKAQKKVFCEFLSHKIKVMTFFNAI